MKGFLIVAAFVVGCGIAVFATPAGACEGAGSNFGKCDGAAPVAAAKPSLYKRLGGREGIGLVMESFVDIMAADPRVNARFKDMKPADVEKLKSNAADQVCDATGGPCAYLGRDMKTTHKGMNITEAEWTATVEDLVKALDKNKVPDKEKQELI